MQRLSRRRGSRATSARAAARAGLRGPRRPLARPHCMSSDELESVEVSRRWSADAGYTTLAVVSGRIDRKEGRCSASTRPRTTPRARAMRRGSTRSSSNGADSRPVHVLEVGPGTGQASRRLLDLGGRVLALEPDPALAAHLEDALGTRIEVRVTALEDAELTAADFDLAVAASSFHWVDEEVGLAKLFEALRPAGWVALWWTPSASQTGRTRSSRPPARCSRTSRPVPPGASKEGPHMRSTARRGSERCSRLDSKAPNTSSRAGKHSGTPTGFEPYGTFSPIARLDETRRSEILDGVARIAEAEFGGRVHRTLVTPLYRRPQ